MMSQTEMIRDNKLVMDVLVGHVCIIKIVALIDRPFHIQMENHHLIAHIHTHTHTQAHIPKNNLTFCDLEVN